MPHPCGAAVWKWQNSRSELRSDAQGGALCHRLRNNGCNQQGVREVYSVSAYDVTSRPGKYCNWPLDLASAPHDRLRGGGRSTDSAGHCRSEEHTTELQSLRHLVCRLLLE